MASDENKADDEVAEPTDEGGSEQGASSSAFRSQPKLWDEPAAASRSDMAPASADAPSSFALRSFSGAIPGPEALAPEPAAPDPSASSPGEDTIRAADDSVELELEGEPEPVPESAGGGPSFDDDGTGGGPADPGDGEPRRDPFALVSLVLGILAYPCCCLCSLNFPVALASVIAGVVSLVRIKGQPELWEGKGLAIGGISASVLNVLLYILWVLLWIVGGGLMGGFGGLWLGAASDAVGLPSLLGG